ncbi:uncharacterized protein LOC118420092 [Branchiostoma floridae]|uniref:Uncharacterized protein LOC118420092 n=1 Tax=Branchiostoma floridae TaxID=7739 RepID=A0A9J7LJ22_BRAFL|nr:uncharacterized protein LOC118420092 [Branchiostoma floridae]
MCPPGCASSSTANVWGTGLYRDLSSICRAAVHDGKITDDRGGQVVVVRQPAGTTFTGSSQNGVTSQTYEGGDFSWSFSFETVIETPTMCPDPPNYEDARLYSGSPPYLYGDKASYVCDGDMENPETGEGPFVLICGLDRTWKGEKPLCTDNSQPDSPSPKTSIGTIVGAVIAALVLIIAVLIAIIIMRRRCLENDSKLQDGEIDGEVPVHYSDVIYSSIINIPPNPVVADQGLAEQPTNDNSTYDQPSNYSTAGNLLTNRGPEFQSANMGELPITSANQNAPSGDAAVVDCTLYNQTDHTYTPLSLRHVEPEYTQPRSHDDVDDDVAHLYATVSQDEGVVDNVIYESSCCQDNETTSGQC